MSITIVIRNHLLPWIFYYVTSGSCLHAH